MRFKAFLNESNSVESAYKPISDEQLYTLAHTQFSEAFSEEYPYIIRGMDNENNDHAFLISKIKGRHSANTSNEYTVLIDASRQWAEYPKRSESLICTTAGNMTYANDFGEPFMILPENGAKIGLCSGFDFWESFPVIKNQIKQSKIAGGFSAGANIFNEVFRNLMHVADIKLPERNKSYVKLVDALNQITDYIKNKNSPHVSAEEKKYFATVISGKETMLEFCDRMLDPKANGFKLVDYKSLKSFSSGEHEVWLSAPSLAITIPDDEYKDLDDLYMHFNKIKSSI